MNDNIIETFDLSKIYKIMGKKEIVALDKINLYIKKGEIFGLLGPNGAGKTTFASILTTLIRPTSGYATINGHNIIKHPKYAKENVSLMLGRSMLYNRISGYDNLKFCCKIFSVSDYKKKIEIMAKDFGLEKWLNEYVERYSTGMRMKLALLRTLLLEREILFLDEPTLGLDVNSTSFIVKKLKSLENTIILTTHDMGVVEQLCDRIAIIDQGKIIKIGTKKEISRLFQSEIKIKVELNNNKNQLKSELSSENFISDIEDTLTGMNIFIKKRESYKSLLNILSKYPILKVEEKEISLGDLFLKIIPN